MTFHSSNGRKLTGRFMTFEPVGLVMFAIIAGGLLLFFYLTGEVMEGDTHAFDEWLLLALRNAEDLAQSRGPFWLDHAMEDITALGGTTVLSLMTILALIYLLLARQRAIALFMFASVVGGWLLSHILKLGVARPRPDIVPHMVEVYDLSFPSGHAMLSAVTYLTLGALLSRTQPYASTRIFLIAVAIFLTLIVGFSRVYLGVHYPTDVLGGWCVGASWALACWMVARRFISAKPSAA